MKCDEHWTTAKQVFLTLAWLLLGTAGWTQDIQFSQFYALPTYQNPAFAGSALQHRFTFHQRLQWRSLDARYASSLFSWDTDLKKLNGGMGAYFVRDYQGGDKITSNEFAAQYAQEIPLSGSMVARLGIQVGGGTRTVDYSQFMYAQDFTSYGYQGNTYDQYGKNTFSYWDLSSGAVLFSDHLWIGVAAHHLNKPVQTFYNAGERWPTKWGLTGGYRLVWRQRRPTSRFQPLSHAYTVTPTFHYKLQGKSDQLDLGLYSQMDRLLVGVWYRGIPLKRYDVIQNNESAVALVGLKYHQVVMTYSYDLTMSRLVRAVTGGSHEVNLTVYWDRQKPRRKPMKRLPCPDYFD